MWAWEAAKHSVYLPRYLDWNSVTFSLNDMDFLMPFSSYIHELRLKDSTTSLLFILLLFLTINLITIVYN